MRAIFSETQKTVFIPMSQLMLIGAIYDYLLKRILVTLAETVRLCMIGDGIFGKKSKPGEILMRCCIKSNSKKFLKFAMVKRANTELLFTINSNYQTIYCQNRLFV